MTKCPFVVFIGLLIFSGIDCKKNPVAPPGADTTSHDFTWHTYVLGDGNASTLRDVAIVSDTLVYVVGDIEKVDSTGQFDICNFAIWDGKNWTLQKAPYDYQGQYLYYPIYSVFAFNSSDIWLESGIHWDGREFQTMPFNIDFPSHVNKMWGTSDVNLYAVGNNGLIGHRGPNGIWQSLNSGTSTDINDAWGLGSSTVYCAVSNPFDPNEEKKILKITNGDRVDSVKWIGRHVYSVWTPDGAHLYAAGDGVFENDGSGWKEMKTGASIGTSCIRGNATNDIVVVGGFGFIAHWNGASWKIYPPAVDVIYKSVAVRNDMIVAVGTTGSQGVVTIGER